MSTPISETEKTELLKIVNDAQNIGINGLLDKIEELDKSLLSIDKRLKELEPSEPPEPEEPESKQGFLSKLVAIFVISYFVLYYCKDWKSQVVYIIASLLMRVVLVWQLPAIIQSFGGG